MNKGQGTPSDDDADVTQTARPRARWQRPRPHEHVTARILARVFLVAGSWALLCIPCVFLSEAGILPIDESWFHSTQCLACVVGFLAALVYLILPRARVDRRARMRPPRRPARALSIPREVKLVDEQESRGWRPSGERAGAVRVLAWIMVVAVGALLGLAAIILVHATVTLSDF